MSRIRTIKPEFFQNPSVSSLSLRARLTWIGLWTQADDVGRYWYSARRLKGALWPEDDSVTWQDVENDIDELEAAGKVRRYEVDGQPYLEIPTFLDHQKISNPSKKVNPAPPWATGALPEHSMRPTRALRETSLQEGEEDQGSRKGEAPPPRHCPSHPNGIDAPCFACKKARLAHEQWEKQSHHTPSPGSHADQGYCKHWIPLGGCTDCATEGVANDLVH